MKLTMTIAALMLQASAAHAGKPNDNGPCTTGNAVFCDLQEPQGPQGADGIDGKNGADGIDGIDGLDGRDFDAAGHAASLSAVAAIGSLQMMDPLDGETIWAFGFGGQFNGSDGIAAGIRHGFTDDLSGYMTIGSLLDGNGGSYGIGISGRF